MPWNRTVRRISTGFLPPIALEPEGSTPVYMQLADWFRHAIVQGRLRPGQRLPSTRGLARELNVSRMPVQGAYEQLHTEGYFETFVGAGTCVAKAIPDESLRPGPELMRTDRPTAAAQEAPRSVSRRAGLLRRKPQTWLLNLGAFRVGLPALDHFPVASWARLMKRHLRRSPGDSMAYGYSMGYLPFREAIAE